MSQNAIEVNDVSMKFNLSREKVDSLKDYIFKAIKGELQYNEFWALRDINFSVEKGDRVGILGLNGAGKSTLLKVISGVFKPTTGSVKKHGKMVPLLELGAGFEPQYTGTENIYLYGSMLGYTKDFIDSKYEEIVKFSELQKFMDVPVKNYSSGMKSRLGFSIATVVEPQILILDEVLSVGDAKFRKKSEKKIMSMYTDPEHLLVSDPGHLEGNTVFTYLDAFCKPEHFERYLPDYANLDELKAHYTRGGLGDVKVKKFLNNIIQEELEPIRKRRKEYEKDIPEVYNILRKGTEAAREVAAQTLSEVKSAMKINYFDDVELIKAQSEKYKGI